MLNSAADARKADLAAGIDPRAFAQIPLHVLKRLVAIPYAFDGERLQVALADPEDLQAVDELRLASSTAVDVAAAPRERIERELRRLAPPDEQAGEAASGSATELVSSLLETAASEGASDIHLVPSAEGLAVRARIDGVVHQLQTIPRADAGAVLARVKVLAKIDIAEHRKPQDGRLSLTLAGRELNVRVATLPSVEGEGAVLRLLARETSPPTLTDLGLGLETQMQLEEILQRRMGALFVTGPTGSGKTTTLHALLADVAQPDINVITVEDPVEYRLPGAFQLQVNARIGVTFATALRSILRSDPDVIMIGEMRDAETAKIAIEAALTGHLVLSTMHTNDAPSAITRLDEMGIEPFLTASSVTAVLAQRLTRRLCVHCREPYEASAEELVELDVDPETAAGGRTLYRRRGCGECSRGYRGRVGIFQLMVLDDELRRLAIASASHVELEKVALAHGMRTLWDDGVDKALAGLTSIEEVQRVVR